MVRRVTIILIFISLKSVSSSPAAPALPLAILLILAKEIRYLYLISLISAICSSLRRSTQGLWRVLQKRAGNAPLGRCLALAVEGGYEY